MKSPFYIVMSLFCAAMSLCSCTGMPEIDAIEGIRPQHPANTVLSVKATVSSDMPLQSDRLFAYNITQSQSSVLTLQNGYYVGDAYVQPNDEVACLYPCDNYVVSKNRLTLNMPSLNGTVGEQYYWGFAKALDVDSKTHVSVTLFPLLSACKLSVVDENGQPVHVKSITLHASKGQFYQSRALNLQTGSWEAGTPAESIVISTGETFENGVLYLNLIPTSVLITAEIVDANNNVFSASCDQEIFKENEVTELTMKCTTPASAKEYVEVCGTKWAQGNLLYAADEAGDAGFQTHWMLAKRQWEYFDIVYGTAGTPLAVDLPYDPDHVHLFNWGTCGDNALVLTAYGTRPCTDIAAKMYKDKYLKYETTNFSEALFGDIVFWASLGKWRMPRYEEMYTLFDTASYECGYVTVPDGQLVYGILFTTPVGERITNTKYQYFTQEQIDNGLFLPGAGYRQKAIDIIKRTGKSGFYWNSYRPETANQLNIRFIGNNLFWSGDGGTYGRSIRPVLNE